MKTPPSNEFFFSDVFTHVVGMAGILGAFRKVASSVSVAEDKRRELESSLDNALSSLDSVRLTVLNLLHEACLSHPDESGEV